MTTYGNGEHRNGSFAFSGRALPKKISGYAAELLVEVYALLGAGGKLTSFRPNIDIDHKDLVFDELGPRLRSAYVQVKCVTRLNKEGQVTCIVRYLKGRPIANDRLVYVFAYLDTRIMALEKIWFVPSKDFNRLATRMPMKGKGITLEFHGYARKRQRKVPAGRWDRFAITAEELGPRFLKLIETARAATPLHARGLLQMLARP